MVKETISNLYWYNNYRIDIVDFICVVIYLQYYIILNNTIIIQMTYSYYIN